MRPEELATNATLLAALQPLHELLNQVLASVTSGRPAGLEQYLSVDQVATITNYSAKTVRKWVKQGKVGPKGKTIYLPYLEFSLGQVRIPLSALVAFGQNMSPPARP